MPTPRHLLHLQRNTPTIAPIANRGLLLVSGLQCSEFLNGIFATSVANPARGPFFTTVLHPQGRVLHDAFVFTKKDAKGQDSYIIEYDSRESEAPPLLPALKRFVLRSKVKIQDVSNDYDVWSVWGSEMEKKWETPRQWNWARSGVVEPVWPDDNPLAWPWGTQELSIRDRRAVGMGNRILVSKGSKPIESSSHDVVDKDAYTLHRIMHGVPEGIVDIQPMHATPMESNLDAMGGLDFRKGCYVGQELTVRTYHLGTLRKRILPVAIGDQSSTTSVLPTGQFDIRASYVDNIPPGERPRLRGNGRLLSTVQGVGLAMMRLEHVDAADRGILKFIAGGEEVDGRVLNIQHWWPDWWPERSSVEPP